MPTPPHFWDRAQLAAGGALDLDPDRALSALIAPYKLTPEEAKTPAERMGLKGFFGGAFDLIADPVVLLALATSFRFGIPKSLRFVKNAEGAWVAKNMFDVAEKVKSTASVKNMPWLWRFYSAHSNFYGTDVPEAITKIVRDREAFLTQYLPAFGDAIRKYQAASGQPFTHKTQVLLTAALKGLDKGAPKGWEKFFRDTGPIFRRLPEDQPFRTLVADWRTVYDRMWDASFKDPSMKRDIMMAIKRVSSGTGQPVRAVKGPLRGRLPADPTDEALEAYFKKQAQYAPTYMTKNMDWMIRQVEEEIRRTMETPMAREAYHQAMVAATVKQVAGSAFKTTHRMLPEIAGLELAGPEYVNPKALEAIKAAMGGEAKNMAAGELPKIFEYNMRASDVASQYVHGMASMWSWTVRGGGNRILDAHMALREAGDHVRTKLLQDTYIPMLMGRMTYDQALKSQVWAGRVGNWVRALDDPKNPLALLPKSIRKTMQGWLLDVNGNPTIQPWGRTIAGYLYTSTLGGNLSAAMRNLGQLMLTTVPTIGAKWTGVGITNMTKKSGVYFSSRAKGLQHAEAFAKAFPEYHTAGIPASPYVDEALGNTLSRTWDSSAPLPGVMETLRGTIKTPVDRAKMALMSFFSISENVVRLSTFEGAYAKALREGAQAMRAKGIKMPGSVLKDEALRFARKTTEMTQFLTGPQNTPYFAMKWGPIPRQFLQFPSRYTEATLHAGTRLGAGQAEEAGEALGGMAKLLDKTPGLRDVFNWIESRGYNPGTLARQVLWSWSVGRMAYHTFGLDMTQSLMPGALPLPRNTGPLAPLPIVPPALSPLLGLAKDIMDGRGRYDEFRKSFAVLVPGGVAAVRAATGLGALGQVGDKVGKTIAEMAGTTYADYQRRTPDGRYPVYTASQNLIGYATPAQLLVRATGVAEGGTIFPTERDLYRFIVANRDRIRDYRRDYIMALLRGEVSKASRIDRDFQKAIPNVGSLQSMVSEKDIENYQTRQDVTRMEKLLDTLPPNVRPVYASLLQDVVTTRLSPQFMGFLADDALTSYTTAGARHAVRANQPQRGRPNPAQMTRYPTTNTYQDYMSPLGASQFPERSVSHAPVASPSAFSAFRP